MTVTLHPREMGATIRCDRCKLETITTGQALVGPLRAHAKKQGWIRGLRKRKWINPATGFRESANTGKDIGPECAGAERHEEAERKRRAAERRAARDEKRKALLQGAA